MYSVNSNGTLLKRLTKGSQYDHTPSWSPDGKRIIFARGQFPSNLMIMNADGSNLKKFYDCNFNWYPIFSHDGKYVYYSSNCPAAGTAAYGIQMRSINSDKDSWGKMVRGGKDADLTYTGLNLSPDGKFMVFASGRFSFHERNIFVMSIDGKTIKKLTDDGSWNDHPAWSPAK